MSHRLLLYINQGGDAKVNACSEIFNRPWKEGTIDHDCTMYVDLVDIVGRVLLPPSSPVNHTPQATEC
jgi:hypothetical protein